MFATVDNSEMGVTLCGFWKPYSMMGAMTNTQAVKAGSRERTVDKVEGRVEI
jgi:hypothetical protein